MKGPDGPSSAMRGLDGGEPQKYVTSCLQLRSFFYSVVARNELVVVWCGDPIAVECGIWLREGLKDWLTDLGLIPNVIVLRLRSNVFKIFITHLLNRSRQGFRATVSACYHVNNILCVVTNNYQERKYSLLVGSKQNVIEEQKDMIALDTAL